MLGPNRTDNGDNGIVPIQAPQTWGEWTPWTDCSRSCGGGRQSRMRECDSEGRTVLDCTGDRVQVRHCNEQCCPGLSVAIRACGIYLWLCFVFAVDGGFTGWSAWTQCSVTCGNGTQKRNRSCSSPKPSCGGETCEGEREEMKLCFNGYCPVDCVWLEWFAWSTCSQACGGGTRSRARDSLPALHNGRECSGPSVEQEACNEHHCPGVFVFLHVHSHMHR